MLSHSKSNRQKWLKLAMLTVGIGSIYKLAFISDVFYVPMQQSLGLNNSQIAFTLTVYSITQIFAYLFSTYFSDRIPARILIGGSLIVTGLCGFYFATFPVFSHLLIIWAIWGVFCEGMYWPALAKAVRMLGPPQEQGRLFGLMAGGRGIIDTIVAFTGLFLFQYFGNNTVSFSITILFYSLWDVTIGTITLMFLKLKNTSTDQFEEKVTLQDTFQVLQKKEVWLISFLVFFIYCSMISTSYFNPYLVKAFDMPLTVAGIYGIVASYLLRIFAGPLSGFLVDFYCKGQATKFMQIAFAFNIFISLLLFFIPHTDSMLIIIIIITLIYSFLVLAMRSTYTVLCEEAALPRKTTGATIAIACLIGYSPSLFGYPLFGYLLDHFQNNGFRYIWFISAFLMFLGFLTALFLKKIIRKKSL